MSGEAHRISGGQGDKSSLSLQGTDSVPGSDPITLHRLTHLNCTTAPKEGTVVIPILQVRKRRRRESLSNLPKVTWLPAAQPGLEPRQVGSRVSQPLC